jgi:hypothetical protein
MENRCRATLPYLMYVTNNKRWSPAVREVLARLVTADEPARSRFLFQSRDYSMTTTRECARCGQRFSLVQRSGRDSYRARACFRAFHATESVPRYKPSQASPRPPLQSISPVFPGLKNRPSGAPNGLRRLHRRTRSRLARHVPRPQAGRRSDGYGQPVSVSGCAQHFADQEPRHEAEAIAA